MASDPNVGEIAIYGFNFAPNGWALCNGQLMAISQNTALFSLLGTTYGGDGRSTFALPNLQGYSVVNFGQGPGLSLYDLGEVTGAPSHNLMVSEMPAHNHTIKGDSNLGNTSNPSGAFPANTGNLDREYKATLTNPVNYSPQVVGLVGGGQAFSIMKPYLVLNFCIALQGAFPARS